MNGVSSLIIAEIVGFQYISACYISEHGRTYVVFKITSLELPVDEDLRSLDNPFILVLLAHIVVSYRNVQRFWPDSLE